MLRIVCLLCSDISEFGPGTRFIRLYDEAFPDELCDDAKVRRVVFCSGKIYYELLEKRRAQGVDDVAIVRIEQLSPFPFDKVAENVAKYTNAQVNNKILPHDVKILLAGWFVDVG